MISARPYEIKMSKSINLGEDNFASSTVQLNPNFVFSVRVSVVVIGHRGQKQLEEKAYNSWVILHHQDSQGRNSSGEQKQKPWRNGVSCLALHG